MSSFFFELKIFSFKLPICFVNTIIKILLSKYRILNRLFFIMNSSDIKKIEKLILFEETYSLMIS